MSLSGTCSSNGALLTEKTPGSARSEPCCPSCSKGWSPSTLKVYVAAIAANHVEGKSVEKHDWVIRFLRGARKLNPPRPPPPIYPLGTSLVLTALKQGLFEPLQTVEPKFQRKMETQEGWGTARISDDDSCLDFGPAESHYSLQSQVVSLQALPPEEADPALAFLCPIRALRCYVVRTQSFRTSNQLFVCHVGRQKGNAVSK